MVDQSAMLDQNKQIQCLATLGGQLESCFSKRGHAALLKLVVCIQTSVLEICTFQLEILNPETKDSSIMLHMFFPESEKQLVGHVDARQFHYDCFKAEQ